MIKNVIEWQLNGQNIFHICTWILFQLQLLNHISPRKALLHNPRRQSNFKFLNLIAFLMSIKKLKKSRTAPFPAPTHSSRLWIQIWAQYNLELFNSAFKVFCKADKFSCYYSKYNQNSIFKSTIFVSAMTFFAHLSPP